MPRHRSITSSSARRSGASQALGACVWAAAFTLLLSGSLPAAGSGEPPATGLRLADLREDPLTQYRAFRRMHAVCERLSQEGWLDAWTEFDGRTFRYQIVREQGSDRVRNKVLKVILQREQELVAGGEAARSALTPENYDFEKPAVQEPGSRYILLKPKRKDSLLVDGRIVLTPDGNDVLRIEGRLAKNPSFWTSLVDVIRHYGRINGIRVPVATESTAKIKFAGTSRLNVKYEYESINNRPVRPVPRRVAAVTTR